MIREYKQSDTCEILNIINDASLKYKGIIPNDCWKEPYMSEQELIDGFSDGVRMYGYHQNNTLIGVIGVQKVIDVILIRHAYTSSSHQNKGAGSALIEYLLKKIRILVCWLVLGRMPLGQSNFIKNLASFFTQKKKQLYC